MTDQHDRERESRESSTTKFEQATEQEEQERAGAGAELRDDPPAESDS